MAVNPFLKSINHLIFLLLILNSAVQAKCPSDISLSEVNNFRYENTEQTKWFKTTVKPIGVILLLHGLNLKPSKMDSLAKHFQSSGYDVLRAAFAGHRGSLKEQEQVTAEQWLEEMDQHTCLVQRRSRDLGGAPIFLSAFSLGSLIAMAWQTKNPTPLFKSQLLLAPAAFSHWYGDLTKTLFFLKNSFGIPSKNLVAYRSQSSTSLAAYRSMIKLRKMVNNANKESFQQDTLIFIDPKDELVSLEKIEDFKQLNNLKLWKIVPISDSKPTLEKSFHHLIIDQASLGEHHWQELKALSIRHFGH
jgi:esterase/lipase